MAWRCLIVDDYPNFCETARHVLHRDGIEVVGTARSIAEALRRADESGFELVRLLAAAPALQPISVVLTSSYAEEDFPDLIASSPALGFLPKSELSARTLAAAIRGGEGGDAGRAP